MYECESQTIKKAEPQITDAFELWCWKRLLRVPWTARRSNQCILKEISPEYSLEGLMLKLQYFGHLMWRTDSFEKTLMLGKIDGRRRRGPQRMRWLDGITDSMDLSWSRLRSWWWTEKPGVLQSMGSQRVGHDWATELNLQSASSKCPSQTCWSCTVSSSFNMIILLGSKPGSNLWLSTLLCISYVICSRPHQVFFLSEWCVASSLSSPFRGSHSELFPTVAWIRKWKSLSHAQLCATPVDYTVHGIHQVRVLKWVAFPSSRGSSQARDWAQVSRIAGGFFLPVLV